MTDLAHLEQSWALLETSMPEEHDVRVRGLGMSVARGEVLLGIDISGDRHVLIPVPPASKVQTDERSSGIRVGRLKLKEGGARRTFVALSCSKSHLFEYFDIIAAEILHRIESAEDRPDAVAIAVLERWRELLERVPSVFPSLNRLLGLFGELHLLKRLVKHHADAVAWWRGPDDGRYDFVNSRGAIEVKSTRATDDWAVTIHGVGQLEPPAEGALFLSVLKVEPHPAGRSIPEMVEEVVVAGGSRPDVLTKLANLGIRAGDLTSLAPQCFGIREERLYEVTRDFPRIIAESFAAGRVPPGVRTLQYTIDLSSEPPAPLSDSEMTGAVQAFAGADV